MKLKETINLIVGDWSGDGHSKKEITCIKCNLSLKEIKLAYKKGTEIVGFSLSEDVCKNYEDNFISIEKYNKLCDLGMPEEIGDGCNLFNNDKIYLIGDDFVYIYLFIVKLGNPKFSWLNSSVDDNIFIGGYGLFT
jgi:hypothetical protein